MHRWLYFAVSCTAAIGIACGGDDGGKTYDARVNYDAGAAIDAKVVDAPSADARVFDAAPDAPPVVVFDARPDAPPVVVVDAGPDAPPAVVVDAGPDAPPPCVSDPGCTGAGNFCSNADTSITCAAVAGSPTCFKITATTPCAGALTCTGSVTPGQCGCPAPGGPVAVGNECPQLNAQTCSADGRAVLTCGTVDTCRVWTIAVPAADTCDTPEGTGDGLTCVNNQCVCPPNPTSIFYANPVVDRTARPGLVRNGNRFPALCSYDTLTLALAAASNPNFAQTGIAVAAKDNPSPANVGLPAVFANEDLGWSIPTGRIMTTTDDPVSGVGGSGNFTPANFVVVVNNHAGPNPASVVVEGGDNRATRGGSLRGITLVEGSCQGSTCELPGTALLIRNHGTVASAFSALNSVLVEGGGGSIVGESDTATGIHTGAVTATVSGDNVTLDVAGDANANLFTDLNGQEGSGFWIGVAGSADPALNGFFQVNDFVDGNTVIVKNPDASANGTFTATLTIIDDHDWTTGIRVENSNATLSNLVVRDFSDLGGGSRVGLQLASDFTGNAGAGIEADVISVQGGRFYMNSTGIQVSGDDGMNVAIGGSHIDNSFTAGLHMNNGDVAATGVIQSGTFSEGEPAVGYLVTGGADVTLNGVTGTANATHGLLYLADGVGSLIDNGSTFTANGSDGVNVSGGIAVAKPQAIDEANVELRGSQLTANDRYGLNVEADGHTVWVRGGNISTNGEDGIHQSGDSLLVTNALSATRAEITTNGDSGLEATAGEIRMNDTNVTGNATNDNCDSEVAAEDLAVNAVIIDGNATLHAVNLDVRSNRGGGIDINTEGAGRPNTISGGVVSFNISTDTCFSGETDPSSGPGILVREGAHLQFVNSPTTISGNASVGLYVEGTVDEFSPARTDPVAEASAALTVSDNEWTGIIVAAGGFVQQTGGGVNVNGTSPAGTTFNDGVHVFGTYLATNTGIASNKGDGIIVDLNTAADRATLTNTSIHNNLGNGVVILSAPGDLAGAVDTLDPVTDPEYGFLIRTSPGAATKVPVFSNGGDGFQVGSASQTKTIVAKIGDVEIHHNTGVGINVRQNSTLTAPATCTDGVGNGCTGVSILSNNIYANTGGGILLRTAFIKRLLGGAEQRGFSGNTIFHNALATCGSAQTASQIVVNGPTGLANGACQDQSQGDCPLQNNPALSDNGLNNQCVFLGGQCVVAWDLSSGPTADTCSSANSFRDYVRNGAPNENQEGGIFATQGARVLAGFNNWPQTSPVENIDFSFSADGNSVVIGGTGCNSSGFTCNEPPPAP